jgi:hypothetical protein
MQRKVAFDVLGERIVFMASVWDLQPPGTSAATCLGMRCKVAFDVLGERIGFIASVWECGARWCSTSSANALSLWNLIWFCSRQGRRPPPVWVGCHLGFAAYAEEQHRRHVPTHCIYAIVYLDPAVCGVLVIVKKRGEE